MEHSISFNKMLEKARRYCLRGEKCLADVRTKLFQWKIPPEYHEEILDSLIVDKFVDEQRYTESFVNDKAYITKWGKIKIRFALSSKNISEQIVEGAIEDIEMDRYIDILKSVLKSKMRTLNITDLNDQTMKQKVFAYLSQRGYEADIISQCMDEIN